MQNTGLLRRLAAIAYDTLLVAALLFLTTIPFIALRGGEAVEIGDNTVYRTVLVLVVYAFLGTSARDHGRQAADFRDCQRPFSCRATVMGARGPWVPMAAMGPGQFDLARPHQRHAHCLLPETGK
jgi:hypothetical protein